MVGNGEHGFQRMVTWVDLYLPHFLIFVSGVGNTKSNNAGGSEDANPEELASSDWMRLLEQNDGVYTLKRWKEVERLGVNKVTIAMALRELMRQTWSA